MTSLVQTSQSAQQPGVVEQVIVSLGATFAWLAPARPAAFAPAHVSQRARRLMRADH